MTNVNTDLRIDWMGAVLGVGLLLIVWSFYRIHQNPNVDLNLFDLLLEGGRMSKISVAFMVAFCFSTWLMAYLALAGKMTEGYFGLYGTLWVGPLVARVIFNKQDFSTTETTKETTKTSTVPADMAQR